MTCGEATPRPLGDPHETSKTKIFLAFNCGCKERLESPKRALEHIAKRGHIVAVLGEITPGNSSESVIKDLGELANGKVCLNVRPFLSKLSMYVNFTTC